MTQGDGMVIWVFTSSAVVLGSFGMMLIVRRRPGPREDFIYVLMLIAFLAGAWSYLLSTLTCVIVSSSDQTPRGKAGPTRETGVGLGGAVPGWAVNQESVPG